MRVHVLVCVCVGPPQAPQSPSTTDPGSQRAPAAAKAMSPSAGEEEEEGDENDAEVAILSATAAAAATAAATAEGGPEARGAEDREPGGCLEPGPRAPRSHRDVGEDPPEGEGEGEGDAEEGEEGSEPRRRRQRQPRSQQASESEVSEVDIPNVGRIMVRADADGYNEEVRRQTVMGTRRVPAVLLVLFVGLCAVGLIYIYV